jgi:hypothetical protein
MKNSCKLTLITDSFRQFYQNQSVASFVLLFEVHITFGFQSEVPTLFQNEYLLLISLLLLAHIK